VAIIFEKHDLSEVPINPAGLSSDPAEIYDIVLGKWG